MVGEPVEQGAGEALAAEDVGPFVEGQVAGDQGGSAFVALREDFEEKFGAGLRQRHEAEFVDDQELDLGEALLVAQKMLLVAGFDERVDEGGGAGPEDGVAALARSQAQAEREMALAGAGVAEGDDVSWRLMEPPQARSMTKGLLTLGMARKSKASSDLGVGKRAALMRRSIRRRSRSMSSNSTRRSR